MGTERQPLRIGIDGTCFRLRRGYGRFLGELLPALLECDRKNEYTLFLDAHTAASCRQFSLRTVQVATSVAQADAASARSSRSLQDMWNMGRAAAHEKLDLMYFPSVYSFYPVLGRTPVAVTFHDTIAERYADIVFPTWRMRWSWKAKVSLARHQARGIVTVSEWSRRSLAEWFNIPTEKIYVIPEAASSVFRPIGDQAAVRRWLRERNLGRPYVVYVGGFNPHKNLKRLIEAFSGLVRDEPDAELDLVLVGDYETDLFHAEVEGLRRQIHDAGIADRVHFPGFVPDAELRYLYAGALALVLPSLEEGFGLPAVEAAACGTACVATRNSPLPELLAGGGLFFDPQDRAELSAALRRVVRQPELRRGLAAMARERAESLSWRSAAEATQRALESIARGSRAAADGMDEAG